MYVNNVKKVNDKGLDYRNSPLTQVGHTNFYGLRPTIGCISVFILGFLWPVGKYLLVHLPACLNCISISMIRTVDANKWPS